MPMTCPKCGSENIVVRYHDTEGRPCAGNYTYCDGARWYLDKPQRFYGKEHLSRRCDTCLYAWAEKTVTP